MNFSYFQDGDCTALRVASFCGQAEVAGVLIARGAAVDYQDEVRQSCMIRIITVVLKNSMIVGIILIISAWETSQGLQCTLDPCCVYTIAMLAQ